MIPGKSTKGTLVGRLNENIFLFRRLIKFHKL